MNIPTDSPLIFLGILFVLVGGFLILSGSGIVTVHIIIVEKSRKTLIAGIIVALLGGITLWKEIVPASSDIRNKNPIKQSQSTPKVAGPSPTPSLVYDKEFFDDFSIKPRPEWKIVSGDWTVINGKYTVTNVEKGKEYITILEGSQWTDVIVTLDITLGRTNHNEWGGKTVWDWCDVRICPRMVDADNGVCFWIGGKNGVFQSGAFQVGKDGQWGQSIGHKGTGISKAKTIQLKVEVKDNLFTTYVDGKQYAQFYNTMFPSGSVWFKQNYSAWDRATIRTVFDNVEITEITEITTLKE